MGQAAERCAHVSELDEALEVAHTLHGKEGVDGSSPSEGSAKPRKSGLCCLRLTLLLVDRALGMEPFMELPS